MSDIAISVSGVSKCYRVFETQRSRLMHAVYPRYTKGIEEIWALKDINFEIKRGEAVAIIGRNGGGKSTLLEILTGTLTPTTGTVKVNGRVSALLELGSGFNPEYSGRDNVILNGLLLGLTKDEILDRFAEIEAFAEIGSAIDRPVKTYSSGMIMRLAFAVQVLCDPDILIIDEALSVGDFFFQQKCMSYILGLCAKGVTLLFVSHDMGTVRDICSRGIFLNTGCIDYDGENLEAIRRYLKFNNDISTDQVIFKDGVVENRPGLANPKLQIKEQFWSIENNEQENPNRKLAYLIALEILDEEGKAATSVLMGSFVKIRIKYINAYTENVHVHVVIKNRWGQIITSIGSHNLNIPLPSLSINREFIFELGIQLAIEAGSYVMAASLAIPSKSGHAGRTIDETPWIGPIDVLWNYNIDVPPFYGLAGMNCTGKFINIC
jgi:lipopolysaccharide transport system ATP-binding protein